MNKWWIKKVTVIRKIFNEIVDEARQTGITVAELLPHWLGYSALHRSKQEYPPANQHRWTSNVFGRGFRSHDCPVQHRQRQESPLIIKTFNKIIKNKKTTFDDIFIFQNERKTKDSLYVILCHLLGFLYFKILYFNINIIQVLTDRIILPVESFVSRQISI
jgi:hypothetical protein